MNIVTRYGTMLFLFISVIFALLSCENTFSRDDEAKVEIILQVSKDIGSIKHTNVQLYYVTGNTKKGITATLTSNGHYEAVLPAGCISAKPFIEVSLEKNVYHYTISDYNFTGGRRYTYLLKLNKNGLSSEESDIIVSDWEVIDAEVSFN